MTILRCIDEDADLDFRLCMSDFPRVGQLYTLRGWGHIMYANKGIPVFQYGYVLEEIKNEPCICMMGMEAGFFPRRFTKLGDIRKKLEPPAMELDLERRKKPVLV